MRIQYAERRAAVNFFPADALCSVSTAGLYYASPYFGVTTW
jgi:hypothetical protein